MHLEIYAKALWKAVERGSHPKDAVRALHAFLETRGRASLMPRITRVLARLALREENRKKLVLSVAKEEDAHRALREAAEYLERINADKSDVIVRVDPTVIGGWRLEGREILVDASYRKQLLSLYNLATK